jgi:hypothetical protein
MTLDALDQGKLPGVVIIAIHYSFLVGIGDNNDKDDAASKLDH